MPSGQRRVELARSVVDHELARTLAADIAGETRAERGPLVPWRYCASMPRTRKDEARAMEKLERIFVYGDPPLIGAVVVAGLWAFFGVRWLLRKYR
jgi:hypothetical protein